MKNGPVAGGCRHTKLICWGECWGKEPRLMRFGFIINGLAATDGGFLFRHMHLLVIGLGHDHSLMLTSNTGKPLARARPRHHHPLWPGEAPHSWSVNEGAAASSPLASITGSLANNGRAISVNTANLRIS